MLLVCWLALQLFSALSITIFDVFDCSAELAVIITKKSKMIRLK